MSYLLNCYEYFYEDELIFMVKKPKKIAIIVHLVLFCSGVILAENQVYASITRAHSEGEAHSPTR